jgi:hypothetical protein
MLLDLALILYLITAIVATYGFVLFGVWWILIGDASTVYAYTTWLLFGISLMEWLNVYARIGSIVGEFDTLFCWWWPWRVLIPLVCVTLIVSHMSYNVFYLRKRKLDTDN